MMRKRVIICLIMLCFIIGCVNQTVKTNRSENEKNWKIVSYPAIEPEEKVYHWVLLQNDRDSVDEEIMVELNKRLQECGMQERIQMHVVTVEQLVTPEIVEAVKKELDDQMDFISISPSLIAFEKADWRKVFIDLTEELRTGKLKEFYDKIPEKVWEVNRIAEGQFSFSNRMRTFVTGYAFSPKAVEKIGEENIASLQQANGFENEAIWKKIYEEIKGPVGLWYGAEGIFTSSRAEKEEPYEKDRFSVLTGYCDLYYLGNLTDDIRFNYELKRFEWIGDSTIYEEMVRTLFDYYKKGYLVEEPVVENEEDLTGFVIYGTDAVLLKGETERPAMWVPLFEKPRIVIKKNDEYYYSGVFTQAKDGWQKVLNTIGTDEALSWLLTNGIVGRDYELEGKYGVTLKNHPEIKSYSMIMTDALLYDAQRNYYDCALDVRTEDRYDYLKKLYEEAQDNTWGDFVFNPASVQKQFNMCQQAAFLYRSASFVKEMPEGERNDISIDEFENFWKEYKATMKEKGIDEVVEEINRQYQRWTEN